MAWTFSRRDVLKASSALALALPAASVRAAAPPATAITPDLIAAAQKEGKVVYYTSIDLPLAEKIAKAFEAKYPGIAVRVERTGAERVFQRIGQEYASRIHAVDVVNSSDAAHFIVWKRDGILARIARLNANGSFDTSFDPGSGPNGPVHALFEEPLMEAGNALTRADLRGPSGCAVECTDIATGGGFGSQVLDSVEVVTSLCASQ